MATMESSESFWSMISKALGVENKHVVSALISIKTDDVVRVRLEVIPEIETEELANIIENYTLVRDEDA